MHKGFFPRIISLFSNFSHQNIIILCIVQVALICWLDYATGDYALIVLYLIPVSLVSWFVSTPAGLVFCLLSIAARVVADLTSDSVFAAYPAIHYWNIITDFIVLLITSLLFSTLKNSLDAGQRRSRRDPLTGALNRNSFFEQAEHELNRSRRYNRPFSVIYLDINDLKSMNERFGHQTGDELLVSLVSILGCSIRSYESLSRFGGDEFIILMPEAGEEAALSYLAKISSQLKQAMRQKSWDVSISICALIYLTAPDSVDNILHKAEELMESVKRSGKSNMLHTVVQ